MAKTPSQMVELGTSAPSFELLDVRTKNIVKYSDCKKEHGALVMFICNHCPYVIHVWDELMKIGSEFEAKGIGVVAISSNDASAYPDDRPEKMAEKAETSGMMFPYLYDESQNVAKAYHAACTPDFFLYDRDNKLVYRGQLDSSRPGNDVAVDGRDLRSALENLIAGKEPLTEQRPSLGCNIKWKM